jgi:hypothetical protein
LDAPGEDKIVEDPPGVSALFAAIVMLLVVGLVFAVMEMAYRLVRLSRVVTRKRTIKLTMLFVMAVFEILMLARILL